MSNGNSTGTGLRPIPANRLALIAFSCTSAGVERGSHAGTRRWPANVKSGSDRGPGGDLGAELIEDRPPFDADGRDRRRPELFGGGAEPGREANKGCQPTHEQADSHLFNASPPGACARNLKLRRS